MLYTERIPESRIVDAKEPYFICAGTFPGWQPNYGAQHSFATLAENGTLGGYGGAAYFHGGRCNAIFYGGNVKSVTAQQFSVQETAVRDRTNF